MANERERTILEWRKSDGGTYSSGGWWIWRGYSPSKDGPAWCLGRHTEIVAETDTLDEAKALAQRLQDVLDGVPMFDVATLNLIVNDVVENAMWDVRDAVKSVSEKLRDTIVERITK